VVDIPAIEHRAGSTYLTYGSDLTLESMGRYRVRHQMANSGIWGHSHFMLLPTSNKSAHPDWYNKNLSQLAWENEEMWPYFVEAMKKQIDAMKKQFDPSEHGGSPILGISKPVVKAHGSSNAKAFKNAIGRAIDYASSGVIYDISDTVQAYTARKKAEAAAQKEQEAATPQEQNN
jgi:hypothetical protein